MASTVEKLHSDESAMQTIKPAKKRKFQSYPCGDYKWVEINSHQISDYGLPNCIRCKNHGKLEIYRQPFFVHSEYGEYECPKGTCSGDVKFICRVCNNISKIGCPK